MFDKTEIGSPYRILDQKQRAVKADKTYNVLSGLAKLAGGVVQLQHQDHQKDMERRAKNDLVNNTINPDLQIHERTYAQTIAKGEALNTFQDLKSKVNSGEYDNLSPEDFQKHVNDLHATKAQEYSQSKYAEDAVGTWNDFWVQQESTLTAGQAGKYRIALRGKQESELGETLIAKWRAGTYTAEDMVEEIMNPDYTLMDTDARRDAALAAGGVLAANGDDTLLNIFNEEFDFANDPERHKAYDTALKMAHRKQSMIAQEGALEVRQNIGQLTEEGMLTMDHWNQDVTNGVGPNRIPLSEAKDANGNPIMTLREFDSALTKSYGNFVGGRTKEKYKEMIQSGVNVHGLSSDPLYQEAVNDLAQDIMDKDIDIADKAAQVGQLASKQTGKIKMITNMGDTFANLPLMDKGEIVQETAETYNFMEALRQGYGNDAKFYRNIGEDAAARFKIMEHAAKYAVGDSDTKALIAAKTAAQVEDRVATGLVKPLRAFPEDFDKDLDKQVKKYLGEQDKWYKWDSRRDEDIATNDFKSAFTQHYKFLVEKKGLTHEPAMELAMEQTKGASMLFDGSLHMTWGAEFNFGDAPENIVATLKNDESIKAIVAAKHSSGESYDLRETPGLDEPAVKKADPDWDKVRLVPNADSNSIMFIDDRNELVYELPVEHAVALNEAKRQGVHNGADLDLAFSEAAMNTPAGKRFVNKQIEENERFAQEVLKDPEKLPIIQNIEKPSVTAYAKMTEKERTAARLEYHRENFQGVQTVAEIVRDLTQGTYPNGVRVLAEAGVKEFKAMLKPGTYSPKSDPSHKLPEDDQATYEERMKTRTQGEAETIQTEDGEITSETIAPYDDLIDFSFIAGKEGGMRTDGYVPEDINGQPHSNSGVTIGVGVDLAHVSEDALRYAGVSEDIIEEVKPAIGLKGQAAAEIAGDINLSESQAQELTGYVQEREFSTMINAFEKDADISFKELPDEWRTVLASVFWQYGRQATGFKFWGYLVNQDYDSALVELEDFGDDFPTRRNAEAALIKYK